MVDMPDRPAEPAPAASASPVADVSAASSSGSPAAYRRAPAPPIEIGDESETAGGDEIAIEPAATAMADRPDRQPPVKPAAAAAGIEIQDGLIAVSLAPSADHPAPLASIGFAPGSAVLPPHATAHLERFLAEVKAPDVLIRVVGEADTPALALDRAMVVGIALVQRGVPADRLDLSLAPDPGAIRSGCPRSHRRRDRAGALRASNGNGRPMKHGQFHRIRRLPPYVFSEVNAMKAAARAAGHDIIDFGMGNPDGATPQPIVDKLIEAVRNPRTHRYSTSRGIPGLRRAQAAYYQRRFGVALDPETEIVVTLGSKEGLANLAQAITAPGDVILVPNPSYPIHPYGFIIAGAAIRHVPLVPEADLMAELAHATEHSVPPPTAIVLNFPSNPTGHVVDLDFYREAVSFARRRDILLLSDLAYAEIYFAEPPPSILQVPGAKDVAVEFTSLSKTYSMPGWRIGFAAGNASLIAALTRIKSYLDYGAFTPIQVAATAALNHCDAFVAENRTRYRERRDVLVEGLQGIGWPVAGAAGDHVRLGADPGAVPRARLARVQQAPAARSHGRGFTGAWFRRVRRRLRALRPGREPAAHPPGGAQHQDVLRPQRAGAGAGGRLSRCKPRCVWASPALAPSARPS